MPNRKKPELQRKTHNMKIRLDDIQYSTIQLLAEESGMTMTEYIRHQAVHGKVDIHYHIVADFEKLDKLNREFSAIGNNLNQLTKYFNMGGLLRGKLRAAETAAYFRRYSLPDCACGHQTAHNHYDERCASVTC